MARSPSSPTNSQSSSSRLKLPPLAPPQVNQLRELGKQLLRQALGECARSTMDESCDWEFVRSSKGHNIFEAKPGAPSDVMISSIVHGKLHDVMTCLYSEDSHTFRVNSALMMPKEFIDGEVLHAIDVADDDHPFRFTGLKWCATKWPGSAVNKSRDLCYFESTGMVHALDPATGQPATFGYNIMESIHMPWCTPLGKMSFVRAKVSIRRIFRELPIGITLVMTHCTIDPRGTLSSLPLWRSDVSSMPHLLAISRATDVAESIWLSQQLQPHIEKQKTSFLAQARCVLCRRSDSKLEKKRVIECTSEAGPSIRATKRHFCSTCLVRSPPVPPRFVPPVQLDEPPTDPALLTLTMSHRSSLHLSQYSDETPLEASKHSTVPILDQDSDDDDGDSIYSGLEFDATSQEPFAELEEVERTPQGSHDSSPQYHSLSVQLSVLTARMDETLVLLQQQRVQIASICSSKAHSGQLRGNIGT
ncbi:hypothetical protein LEN26_018397 [Aphanomyces euteiches]|nr:hypothetical protein LEN26_018397 [Aphanomyces euteiches]KAH9116099.1 hypothetical protein AeMF1_009904 [Aphanomyces euteiches]KAH9193968.1 hypothetical protein AeNC1_004066 [Aphanomyces euteiches]